MGLGLTGVGFTRRRWSPTGTTLSDWNSCAGPLSFFIILLVGPASLTAMLKWLGILEGRNNPICRDCLFVEQGRIGFARFVDGRRSYVNGVDHYRQGKLVEPPVHET